MDRKHFEAVAACIKASVDEETRLYATKRTDDAQHAAAWEALRELTRNLSDQFAGFNPRFDRERFDKACGF
jgi:hypothetical protein